MAGLSEQGQALTTCSAHCKMGASQNILVVLYFAHYFMQVDHIQPTDNMHHLEEKYFNSWSSLYQPLLDSILTTQQNPVLFN